MQRWQHITLNWLGTTLTWISAPIGGGAAAVFLWLCLMLALSLFAGGANPTLQGMITVGLLGLIGAVWCAAVWFVLFLHKSIWSRFIHFAGCTLAALPGVPLGFLALQAVG